MHILFVGGAVSMGSKSVDAMISNNLFDSNSAANQGGAISISNLNNNLHLENNEFYKNSAKQGGSIYFSTSNPNAHIDNCTFAENVAVFFGGAITFAQEHVGLVILHSTFISNSAITSGGALYFGVSITESSVKDCLFQSNFVVDYGGGAIAMASFNDINVMNCHFLQNLAFFGGAIFTLLKAERFNMVNSTLRHNRALYGGAFYFGAISEEVTLSSLNISHNVAEEDGGGIYVDVASILHLSEVMLDSNVAYTRGGGLYYESDGLTVHSSTFMNNSASELGGAMFVKGDDITIASATTMDSNGALLHGGALYLEESYDVSVENVIFVRNVAGGNGGGAVFNGGGRINITVVSYLANTAIAMGGAVHLLEVEALLAREATLWGNEAQGTGGGFSLSDCMDVSFVNSSFVNNSAVGGSAVWTSGSSIDMYANAFTGNRNPTSGGTVFWRYDSGMVEPGGLRTANTFRLNNALYGRDFATEAVGFTVSTEASRNNTETNSFIIADYNTPIIVNAIVHDHYNQQVLSDNSTFMQMSLGEEYECGDRLPTVSGSTLCEVRSGACKFQEMFGVCNPGGEMQVRVVDVESSTLLESPLMKWSFRQCLRGEYYRDGECNWCEQGFYSKKDNVDLSVTDCTKCPVDASECYADVIVLKKGYWAMSVDSEGMTLCPMGEEACIGGIQILDDASVVEDTTDPVTEPSTRAMQKQHVLHHRTSHALISSESGYSTLDSEVVQVTGANASICKKGYTGVLCAICDEEFYFSPGSNTCEVCEEGGINTFMIVFLCVVGVLLIFPLGFLALSWTGSTTLDTVITNLSLPALMYIFYMKFLVVKKPRENETEAERLKREGDINDLFARIMPKFKIFISMVQITSAMPAILGMSFPSFFNKVTSIFGLLNLDIVSNMGLSCRFKDVDYVDYLIMTCVAPMICSALLFVMYNCHQLLLKSKKASFEEMAAVYSKYLLVFLMGTYLGLPNISVYIFQTFSCQNIDPDDAVPGEDMYLRADLSIQCGSSRHVTGTTFASLMIFVYPIGIPALYYWLLYKVKDGIIHRNEDISPKLRLAIMPSSFLYSSYGPTFWFWECVETLRRIIMTGVLVLVAQGTSLQIALGLLLSLLFIKLYAHFAPFDDSMLNTDAEFAQYQVFFVLFIALLMKEESIPSMQNVWGILLVCVIFSLLLLSPIRLFRDKCLRNASQHMTRVCPEQHEQVNMEKHDRDKQNQETKRNGGLDMASGVELHPSKQNDVSNAVTVMTVNGAGGEYGNGSSSSGSWGRSSKVATERVRDEETNATVMTVIPIDEGNDGIYQL